MIKKPFKLETLGNNGLSCGLDGCAPATPEKSPINQKDLKDFKGDNLHKEKTEVNKEG